MYLTEKVCSFTVIADSKKEAYLKGCKKAAKYVGSQKYRNMSSKIENVGQNEFVFTLFTNIDLSPEIAQFCKMCKEYHCSFFVNEEYNCSRCNLKTFMERTKQKAKVSKEFYKERMKNKEET